MADHYDRSPTSLLASPDRVKIGPADLALSILAIPATSRLDPHRRAVFAPSPLTSIQPTYAHRWAWPCGPTLGMHESMERECGWPHPSPVEPHADYFSKSNPPSVNSVRQASTTSGSYFVPLFLEISSNALSIPSAGRYGR